MLAKNSLEIIKDKKEKDLENLALRVFIEIDKKAILHNFSIFRKIISPSVKFFAVVKSNAYGHGLVNTSLILEKAGVDGLCVDSLIEGIKLRETGIKKPIIALGATLPENLFLAATYGITVTISNFFFLKSLLLIKGNIPDFHIKIDTGMRRQGFFLNDIKKVISEIKKHRRENNLKGVYTHFASAKDLYYPTLAEKQFNEFKKALEIFRQAGFKNLICHSAATGGTLLNKKYHLDAVRIGIGLYGFFPSEELKTELQNKILLKPPLSFKTVITEIKKVKKGDGVGYDFSEKLSRDSKIAILPVGYWHGLPRSLSSIGYFLVSNKQAKIIGKVSMDMTTIDISGLKAKEGDLAVLDLKNAIEKSGSISYEVLTRINPLIKRIYI